MFDKFNNWSNIKLTIVKFWFRNYTKTKHFYLVNFLWCALQNEDGKSNAGSDVGSDVGSEQGSEEGSPVRQRERGRSVDDIIDDEEEDVIIKQRERKGEKMSWP